MLVFLIIIIYAFECTRKNTHTHTHFLSLISLEISINILGLIFCSKDSNIRESEIEIDHKKHKRTEKKGEN